MIRAYLYLLINENNLSKFQWLEFLKLQDARTLVKKYFFSSTEAKTYLASLQKFVKLVEVNHLFYMLSCFGIVGRVIFVAYREIPFRWFLGSTLTNATIFLFMKYGSNYLYNYYVTIYFATCTFSEKSFKSLSSHYATMSLYQLRNNKLNQLARKNLVQFNYLIKLFKYGQSNFNYTFSYSAGLIAVCYRYVFYKFHYN